MKQAVSAIAVLTLWQVVAADAGGGERVDYLCTNPKRRYETCQLEVTVKEGHHLGFPVSPSGDFLPDKDGSGMARVFLRFTPPSDGFVSLGCHIESVKDRSRLGRASASISGVKHGSEYQLGAFVEVQTLPGYATCYVDWIDYSDSKN